MHYTTYVIFKSPVKQPVAKEVEPLLHEILEPFNSNTKCTKYLVEKKIKLADYKRHYKACYELSGRFRTFEGWLDYIGCYQKEDGQWYGAVNPNGRFDHFEIGGEFCEPIPLKDGNFAPLCKLQDVLLRKNDDDGKIWDAAGNKYFHMTRQLPSDKELSELYRKLHNMSQKDVPSDTQIEELKEELRTQYRQAAFDDGCEEVVCGYETNKAKYPTFDDYYESCISFVPSAYVVDGKWVEKSRLFYFHSDETHDKIVKFAEAFRKTVSKCLSEKDAENWYIASLETHK